MRTALSTPGAPAIDWAAVDVPGPRLAAAELSDVLRDRYGIEGRLERMAFERDDVYRLDRASGEPCVVRVSPSSESDLSLALQNTALRAIANADPALPVPRIRPSRAGSDIESIEANAGRFRVRVLSFLSGAPVLRIPRTPAMLDEIGRTLARLDNALRTVPAPASPFPLMWDVRGAPQLRPLVPYIRNARDRQLVDEVLAELETEGLARIASLPAQVIHNDFNPKNILFEAAEPKAIAGIIDFGDVVHGARATDLGVTVSRHLEAGDAMRAPEFIIRGYCALAPISRAEAECLFTVVRARLAMRTAIGSWRLHQRDGRGDLAQIEDALTLLAELRDIGAAAATRAWRAHAGV